MYTDMDRRFSIAMMSTSMLIILKTANAVFVEHFDTLCEQLNLLCDTMECATILD